LAKNPNSVGTHTVTVESFYVGQPQVEPVQFEVTLVINPSKAMIQNQLDSPETVDEEL
jgi:hypothetical protein